MIDSQQSHVELIREIVKKLLKDLKTKQKSEGSAIISLLNQLLTKEEMRHIRVVSFKDGVLKVNVDVPVFLYQLNLKKPLIVDRLQNTLRGETTLKEINFRAGDIG